MLEAQKALAAVASRVQMVLWQMEVMVRLAAVSRTQPFRLVAAVAAVSSKAAVAVVAQRVLLDVNSMKKAAAAAELVALLMLVVLAVVQRPMVCKWVMVKSH